MKLSERIYAHAKELWPQYLCHPFVTEMANGTLPTEKFRYYMLQDYLYLKDYVKIFVEGEPKPILSLMSMKNLEDMLPVDRFVRVHRSFIVQPEKIKVIERGRIVFGHEYIPISDNYKQRLQEAIERRSIWPK